MKFSQNFTERWNQNIHSYLKGLVKHSFKIQMAVLVLSLLSVVAASRLTLHTDLSDLLPDHLPSVKHLHEVEKRLGGTGFLTIGIESPSFEANKKFVEDLVPGIKKLAGPDLRSIEYRFADVQKYLETYGFNYLSTDQLHSLKKELDKNIEDAQAQIAGLQDAPKNAEKKPDMLESWDPRLRAFLNYREGYLSAEDGQNFGDLQPTQNLQPQYFEE